MTYKSGTILYDEVLKMRFVVIWPSQETWLSEEQRPISYVIEYIGWRDSRLTAVLDPKSKGIWWSETGTSIYKEPEKRRWHG